MKIVSENQWAKPGRIHHYKTTETNTVIQCLQFERVQHINHKKKYWGLERWLGLG